MHNFPEILPKHFFKLVLSKPKDVLLQPFERSANHLD